MSQLTIPQEILWNPIISAQISRYLSRKDRLNCKSLISTWDHMTTRILTLSPCSWRRHTELLALLQDASQGVEIYPGDFASERGKDITQLLLLLSGPDRTGLVNLTTLDIMKQPISIEQMSELMVNCPMPRLRILRLSVVVRNARGEVTESLQSKLKLEEVAIRIFGPLSPSEILLLLQSFGDVCSMSLDDSSLRRYRIATQRQPHELQSAWIPPWTFLQIHRASEVLDLYLNARNSVKQWPVLTILTEPGHFFPVSSPSKLPRIVKYRVLKKFPVDISQFCRACACARVRCYMPRLRNQSTDRIEDGEAMVNFVACSLMSVEDNCVLHPLNMHDLYLHINPSGERISLRLSNTSSSSTIDTNRGRRQSPMRSAVEDLIQRRGSEIRRLSIRVCKPGSCAIKTKYAQELPSLARDRILPIIEMCGSSISSLEVSAEIIWACCNDDQTNSKLPRLQEKCLNVRKVMVIASDCSDFGQELHPSAKDISTYLGLFPSLKEVKIIGPRLFSDQTVHEVLTNCRQLRRLYIMSHENSKIDYTPFPKHDTLELLFLELNELSADDGCNRLLNETLLNLFSPKYILLKIEHGKYPSIKYLNAFFAVRPELQWLVVVFNKYGKVMLCHADKQSMSGVEIIKDPTFHLGNLIHTYPELYDIFWNEFQKLSKCSLY